MTNTDVGTGRSAHAARKHDHHNPLAGGKLVPSEALAAAGEPSERTWLRGDNTWSELPVAPATTVTAPASASGQQFFDQSAPPAPFVAATTAISPDATPQNSYPDIHLPAPTSSLGDVILVLLAVGTDGGNVSAPTFAVPAGFNLIFYDIDSAASTFPPLIAYYKIDDGSAVPTDYLFSRSDAQSSHNSLIVGICAVYSPVNVPKFDSSISINRTSTSGSTVLTTDPTYAAHVHDTLLAIFKGNTSGGAFTPPAGTTQRAYVQSLVGAGNDVSLVLVDAPLAAAGAVASVTGTFATAMRAGTATLLVNP